MNPYFRSVFTALSVAVVVLILSVYVIAPKLPRVIGPADVKVTRVFAWPGAKLVRLNDPDGFVRVSSVAGAAEVTCQAEIRAYTQEKDKSSLQQYVASLIEVRQSEGMIDIVTEPQERPDPVDLAVMYDLRVPQGTNLEIETASANVWVFEGCGEVRVRGRNADIQIDKPQGSVTAESINGRIQVRDAPEGGHLRTVNGSITAHVFGGSLDAETTNGHIVARVVGADVAECRLTSRNGGITVMMGDEGGAQVAARTERGRVRSDFDVDMSGGGVRLRRRLDGVIGDGGTRLALETLNGNIWLARSRP